MSTKGQTVLAEFKALPPEEQREVGSLILRQLTMAAQPSSVRRRTIADIAGKYAPNPDPEAKDHDRGFAEAIS